MLGVGTLALAGDQPVAPPDDNARICDSYGPGYTVVPGTNTCIKINGFVRQDLTISSGGSGGTGQPSGERRN